MDAGSGSSSGSASGASARMAERVVVSEGLQLAVFESSGAGPALVFLHGFPDDHRVWGQVVDRVSARFRCVAYDVRGAGRSGPATDQDGYRIGHLVTDLAAVLDAVAPAEAVHLVGHDWGSVQMWEAVLNAREDPRLRGRISSFTSISGPALQHVAAFYATARRSGWRDRFGVLRQLIRSWYIGAFQLPVVPELFLRAVMPPDRVDAAVNGLGLYRANLRTPSTIGAHLCTDVPVQLVVPVRDRFITPMLTSMVDSYVPNLARVEIDAGHWVMRTHPDKLAGLVSDFALRHDVSDGE